jgi:hypothetical protein
VSADQLRHGITDLTGLRAAIDRLDSLEDEASEDEVSAALRTT